MSAAANASRSQAVIRRLQALADLDGGDAALVSQMIERSVATSGAGDYVLREGAPLARSHVLLKGWMLAYRSLEDGRRQITRIVLPGDLYGMGWQQLAAARSSLIAVTPCDYALLDSAQLDSIRRNSIALARALDMAGAVGVALQEEWLLSLGRRTALERVAHLICEVHDRLSVAGLADGASCEFPITQTDLADATGLSIVHVNRVLQELRHAGLITLRSRMVHIHQMRELRDIAAYAAVVHDRTRPAARSGFE